MAAAAAWVFWPVNEPTPFRVAAPRVEHDGFLAISYVGVSREPGSRRITVERLREHLDAAKRAGYTLITLDHVRAFVRSHEPLPRRPLLILFEDGRRETVREAETLLRARNAPATLAVNMEAMERKSFNYPLWRHLRALVRTGRWSFAVRSASLPAESPAFSRAIVERATKLGERLEHRSELALVLPAALRGRGPDPSVSDLGRVALDNLAMAFAVDRYAFNHRTRSAADLSMLRVDPDWTGEELVSRLEAEGPRRGPVRQLTRHDWVHVLGDVVCHDRRVLLDPCGRRTAEAWLAGTESWRCFSGSVSLPTGPDAQCWILLRSGPGRDFVRLGWTGTRMELQARTARRGLLRLASVAVPTGDRAVIDFRLFDRRLRFSVRGTAAPPRTHALPEQFDHGMMGVATWSLRGIPGPATFDKLQLEPAFAEAAICSSIEALRSVAADPPDVVVPEWCRLQECDGHIELVGEGDPAFLLAAAHCGPSVWPLVSLPDGPSASMAKSLCGALARARARIAVDGFLLDFRHVSREAQPSAEFWSELLSGATVSLGVVVQPARVQSMGEFVDRLDWIAIRGGHADIGGRPAGGVTGSHQMLVLRAKRSGAWQ